MGSVSDIAFVIVYRTERVPFTDSDDESRYDHSSTVAWVLLAND
jgi:hypothetical protein